MENDNYVKYWIVVPIIVIVFVLVAMGNSNSRKNCNEYCQWRQEQAELEGY